MLIASKFSDTTAAALTHILLELARHPEHVQKLREELAAYTQEPFMDVLHQKIAHLDHLNGVIYETLRLHPPVPTALQRQTPAEGIEIGGVYIPGNVNVWCPQYVIGRSKCSKPRRSLILFVRHRTHYSSQRRTSIQMPWHLFLNAGIFERKWSRRSPRGHPSPLVRENAQIGLMTPFVH